MSVCEREKYIHREQRGREGEGVRERRRGSQGEKERKRNIESMRECLRW